MHDDLLAVLAASRELPADHDDVLADLILERVEQPIPVAGPRAPMPQGIARRADPVPILITLVIATVLSLASAMVCVPSEERDQETDEGDRAERNRHYSVRSRNLSAPLAGL